MPRVLVADDSELDLQLTQRALRSALPGWEIDVVENGALVSREIGSGERPGLVLLDFKMPGMGATEVLATTAPETLAEVPFVLFSSSVSPSDVDRCRALGIREYVEKPTDPSAYAQAVAGICHRWTPEH